MSYIAICLRRRHDGNALIFSRLVLGGCQLLLLLASGMLPSVAEAFGSYYRGGGVATRRGLLQATPAPAPAAAPAPKVASMEVLPGPKVPAGQPNATDIAINATHVSARAPISTIFAPTDAAFEALASALNLTTPLDLFNATYNATAANITALHVIPGEAITTANLTVSPVITATSLLGYNLTITREPDGNITVTVPGSGVVARVVNADVPYNRSVVQVIDKVLLPPVNITATWPIPLPANETFMMP